MEKQRLKKQRLTGIEIMERAAEEMRQWANLIVKATLVGGPPSLDGKRFELPCTAVALPYKEGGVDKQATYWPMPHDRKGDEIPFVYQGSEKLNWRQP